jgi:sugar lactone lactonase YvrE
MALTAGTIVVANPDAAGGAGAVIAVDPGNGRQTMLSQGDLFVDPSNVAFLADGRLLVSDIAAFGGAGGLIAVDPTNGRQTKIAASTVFKFPSGMAVDATGKIVVAYPERVQGRGTVLRVNPGNGDHTEVAPGVQFVSPVGVALDVNGNLLVTDPDISGLASRLHRIDQGVAPRILATGKPPGAVYFGLAIEGTDHILVVNNPNGPERELLRFHPTTGAMTKVSSGNKLVAHSGVAVEANGPIVVTDQVNGVVRIGPNTGAQSVVSSGGHLAGRPTGIAVRR